MSPPRFFLALFVVTAPLLVPPSIAEGEGSHDWAINQDTHLVGQALQVEGNVTVASGTTLTLEGSHLRVGGLLKVESNATLVLLPSPSGDPSRLSALPESQFWIDVQGHLQSQGAAEVTGLWGNGLASALPEEAGGLQVAGTADLEGIRIRNGSAGVIVAREATLAMRDSLLEDLGEADVIVHGTLTLHNVTVTEGDAGILGKDACDIRVEDSLLQNRLEQVLINGCRATIAHSVLNGSRVAVVANNRAHVTVLDTTIRDYGIDALNSMAYPVGDDGSMLRPIVEFRNVTLEPGPRAQRAVDASGAERIEFMNVTIAGHRGDGLDIRQSSLSIRDSRFHSNAGFGIRLTDGRFLTDPLANGNTFGSGPEANHGGAVSAVTVVSFAVVDEQSLLVPLKQDFAVAVYRAQTMEPVRILRTNPVAPGSIEVFFDAYETDASGQPEFLGPFTYQAQHPAWRENRTGPIDLETGGVLLEVQREPSAGRPVPAPSALLAISGAGLAVLALGAARGLRRCSPGEEAEISRPGDAWPAQPRRAQPPATKERRRDVLR